MKLGACEPIAALNRVKIVEMGEPLVDIRDFCPAVEVVETACPFLRRKVAAMLNDAASRLSAGHKFRVGTALRTLSMQKSGWDRYFERMKEEHPGWPLSALRRATNRYFAPYDQKAPPGHCTGGAVDVVLLGPDGAPLDVIAPTEGWQAAYTYSDKIGPQARRNRMLMVEAMLAAGYSNCREEYWHYSWGDSGWAVRVGETECPYGLVEPPVCVEARYAGASAGEIVQTGGLSWKVRPESTDAGAKLDFAIFWAEGREVSLRIEPAPPELFTSSDRKEWNAMPFERAEAQAALALMPTTPRVYIATRIPEEKQES